MEIDENTDGKPKKHNPRNSGKKHSPETLEKMRQAKLGKKRSAETKAKISAKLSGKQRGPYSASHRAAISAGQKGQSRNTAHLPKYEPGHVPWNKGKPMAPLSEERKQQNREWTKAHHTISPAGRAAISAAQTGRKRSDAERIRQSHILYQYWAQEKQGQTHGLVLTEPDKAYAAGLFDGEGTVQIAYPKSTNGARYHKLQVALSNTDPRPLYWLQSRFQGNVLDCGIPRKGCKPAWRWQCANGIAGAFLDIIRPYLIIKAAQADIGIAFRKTVHVVSVLDGPVDINRLPITAELVAERERLRQELMAINRRGVPDAV